MNLAEWSNLTDERRRELILQWHGEGRADAYKGLAIEAAKILRTKLKGTPGVSSVNLIGGTFLVTSQGLPVPEWVIEVCSFQPGFKLDDLPDQVMGFRVLQVNLGDKREAYLRVWKRLFKKIRGWSDEQTLEWAKKWEGGFESSGSIILSSGPDKLAAPSLIDDQTKTLLGFPSRAFSDLSDEIRHLITEKELYGPSGSGTRFPPLVRPGALDEYNWDYVRRRIRELVQKYTQKQKKVLKVCKNSDSEFERPTPTIAFVS